MHLLQFSSLGNVSGLKHAITTRSGGVSQGAYSSLNLAFHLSDVAEHVCENRIRLANALSYKPSTLVAAQQVHGANVQVVTREYSGRGALDFDSAIPDCDALITNEHDLPLLIQVADCAPIVIVDPINKVLAVVHAGWRSAVASITSKTIEVMRDHFNCEPGNVRCGIGPCLCTSCFEVGEDVTGEVESTTIARNPKWPKPHLDLRKLIQLDLERAGVLPSQLEVMHHCPRCETSTFFSHRGQNGKAGRFGLVAWWG